jgi:hypothetical protein
MPQEAHGYCGNALIGYLIEPEDTANRSALARSAAGMSIMARMSATRKLIASTAAPITALGWLLARLVSASVHRRNGCVVAYGGRLGWWLARHPLGPMAAVTLGRCVLAGDRGQLMRTFAHEAEHIRQFDRWGLAFPLVYCLESLWAGLRGRGLYRGNRFELAAEAAAVEKRCLYVRIYAVNSA